MSSEKLKKKKPHSLKAVAQRELGIVLNKEHQGSDWGGELSSDMLEYAAKDAQVLLPITEIFESKVKAAGLEKVYEIEHRTLPAVLWMQNAGLPFDEEGWTKYLEQVVDAEVVRTTEKLNELTPEHPNDRPPFSVPVTVRVLVRILTPSVPPSAQSSSPTELQRPRTPLGSDTPTLRAAYGDCSDRGNLRPVPSPPSHWRTPPYPIAHPASG